LLFFIRKEIKICVVLYEKLFKNIFQFSLFCEQDKNRYLDILFRNNNYEKNGGYRIPEDEYAIRQKILTP